MIAFIAGLILLTQTSKPITFACPPENIQAAFASLSQLIGHPIKTSTALKYDIIAIDVKNMPIDELMAKIAKVEYGKWSYESEGDYLGIDQSSINQEEVARNKERDKYFNVTIGLDLKILTQPGATLNNQTGMITIPMKNGGSRSLNKDTFGGIPMLQFMQSCGADFFYNVPRGTTVAYSTRPNSMQEAFQPNVLPYFEQYVQDSLKNKATPVYKADLFLAKSESGYLEQQAVAFDKSGEELMNSYLSVPLGGPYQHPYSLFLPSQSSHKSAPDTITLTGNVATYYKAMTHGFESLTPVQFKMLTQPQKFDPLMATVGALGQCARAENENLVASLPDSLLNFSYMKQDQLKDQYGNSYNIGEVGTNDLTISPNQYLKQVARAPDIYVDEKDGTIMVSMISPEEQRSVRINRQVLEKEFGKITPESQLRLADFARIAYACNGQQYNAIDSILQAIAPFGGPTQFSNRYWLAFYGSLNSSQQDSLENGNSLRFGDLDADQQEWLTRTLKHNMNAHSYNFSNISSPNFLRFLDDYQKSHAYQNYFSEAFPNGLMPSTTVKSHVTKGKFYELIPDSTDPTQFQARSFPTNYSANFGPDGKEHYIVTASDNYFGPKCTYSWVRDQLFMSLSVPLDAVTSIDSSFNDILYSPDDPKVKTQAILPNGQRFAIPPGAGLPNTNQSNSMPMERASSPGKP